MTTETKDPELEALQEFGCGIYPAYPKKEPPRAGDAPRRRRHVRGDTEESDYPSVYELLVEEGDPNWAGKKSCEEVFGPTDDGTDEGKLITTVEDRDFAEAGRDSACGFAIPYPDLTKYKSKLPEREEDYLLWLKPCNVNWQKLAPLFRHAASKFGVIDFDGSYPDGAEMPSKAELLNIRRFTKVFYVQYRHDYRGDYEEKELLAVVKHSNGFYLCLHRDGGSRPRKDMRISINAANDWKTFVECSLHDDAKRKMARNQRIIRGHKAAGVSDA